MAKEFKLPNETITITPIPRGNSMIKDEKHVGYFMYPNTEYTCTLPRDQKTGNWVECLTKAEQEFLSRELNANLSFSKSNSYWKKRIVRIKRTEDLIKLGYKMDISKADEYLDFKILSAQSTIANSWDDRYNSLEYKFAIVRSGEKEKEDSARTKIKEEAFDAYKEMKHDKSKLVDYLVRTGRKVDSNSDIDFIRSQVFNVVDNDPKEFVSIVLDPDYDMKVFIDKSLTSGGLVMDGRTTYRLGYGNGDVIGRTLKDAILYLKDKKNQTIYLELQARIENNKK